MSSLNGKLVRVKEYTTSANVVRPDCGPYLVIRTLAEICNIEQMKVVELYMPYAKVIIPQSSFFGEPDESTKFANVYESDLEEIK